MNGVEQGKGDPIENQLGPVRLRARFGATDAPAGLRHLN
jgi:hypothetical protein